MHSIGSHICKTFFYRVLVKLPSCHSSQYDPIFRSTSSPTDAGHKHGRCDRYTISSFSILMVSGLDLRSNYCRCHSFPSSFWCDLFCSIGSKLIAFHLLRLFRPSKMRRMCMFLFFFFVEVWWSPLATKQNHSPIRGQVMKAAHRASPDQGVYKSILGVGRFWLVLWDRTGPAGSDLSDRSNP